MLDKKVTKFHFDKEGKVCGVESGGEIAKCKLVVCAPQYCIDMGLKKHVKSIGKIIRCICIMDHPIPKTKDVPSGWTFGVGVKWIWGGGSSILDT